MWENCERFPYTNRFLKYCIKVPDLLRFSPDYDKIYTKENRGKLEEIGMGRHLEETYRIKVFEIFQLCTYLL